mgnify:CR=1 FL=1
MNAVPTELTSPYLSSADAPTPAETEAGIALSGRLAKKQPKRHEANEGVLLQQF